MPTVLVKSAHLNEKDKKFEVSSGKILFDQLELQGLVLPHGCLAGSCGSCRIEIIEGFENLMPPGAVESDTIDAITKNYCETNRSEMVVNKKIRLSCRAKILGDITIAVLK
ncbi:MAG: 2Fe-2S iron-sulfur cluster-binding protein [Bacteriovorax sp.]|nr:2Fe-2S iron-sulfur cluster-binding protein [Bacteriovorax sp.]